MQRKTHILIIGLVFIALILGDSISYTYARQNCYSLSLVVDSGEGLPPAATSPNCDNGLYAEGTVVELTAQAALGFMVTGWRGTNNDASAAITNAVTMTSNKEVGVSYSTITIGDISPDVMAAVSTSDDVRVIVKLQDPVSAQAVGTERAAAVAQVQSAVLANVLPAGFTVTRQYKQIPALAGTVNAEALAALQQNPWVVSVTLDQRVYATTDISVPAINADDVHAMGITGDGVRVAVLDSGIDTNHPDLSDDIVAQHCFNLGSCPPNGADESGNAEDENGHGTNVSGIITANGVVAPKGFAPDSKIVAIRVLDAAGSGWISDIVAGLDWIADNQGTLKVDVINMSLGGGIFAGNCDGEDDTLTQAFSQLNSLGIVIFAASGNNGSSAGISIPACISHVISVGAVYDSNMGREPDPGFVYSNGCWDDTTFFGKIACFSNSGNQLDILAPGARITSAGMGGNTSTMFGTSQASPTAAGVAALMLEANSGLTPAQIESIMESTGVTTTDSRNGLQFPRIDALNAVSAIARPILKVPAHTSATRDTTPFFRWTGVSGATLYQLQVDNDSNFSSPAINRNLGRLSYTSTTVLGNGTYYWRVRAQVSGAWKSWSARWIFTVDTVPPGRPVLQSPANGAATPDTTPALSWGAVTGATRYTVQVDNNTDFSSPVVTKTVATTSATSSLLPAGRYYWRVRALDKAGNTGAWSTRWSFRVTGGAAPQVEATVTFTPEPTETLEPTETPTPTEAVSTPTPTEVVNDTLQRIESDQPTVQQTGVWTSHITDVASGGSYLYSSGSFDDALALTFAGTQAEVIYVKHPALGTFAIEIDGTVMQLVNSVAAESEFGAVAAVSDLADGPHTLRIYPVAGVIALDAFGVEALSDVPPTPEGTPTQDITPSEVPPTEEVTDVPPGESTPTPTSTPLPLLLPFVETFDSSLNWQAVGAWAFDTQTAYRGAGWFAESTTRGLSSTLTFTQQIDLRTALNPELTFWQKMVLADVDFFALDVSLDGGVNWLTLDLQTGQVTDWAQRTIDLTGYRGQVISLRFRLDTLELLPDADVVTLGVWIDELAIQEALATPTPTQIPTDVPPATELPTSTPVPPTATDLPTSTPVPPTATDLPTSTPIPTDVPTEVPPTEIPTEAPVEGTEEAAS